MVDGLGLPKEGQDDVLSRLGDGDRAVPEQELAAILDAFRHDNEIHRALIARPNLPPSIIHRLVRLVERDADLNDLLRRHAVPGSLPVDLRSIRPRPEWWRQSSFAQR